jgi:hypothetical protein
LLYLDSQFDQFRLGHELEEEMDTDNSNNAKIHFQNPEFLNKESKNNLNANVKLNVPNNMTDLITDDERDSNMSL